MATTLTHSSLHSGLFYDDLLPRRLIKQEVPITRALFLWSEGVVPYFRVMYPERLVLLRLISGLICEKLAGDPKISEVKLKFRGRILVGETVRITMRLARRFGFSSSCEPNVLAVPLRVKCAVDGEWLARGTLHVSVLRRKP